MLLRIEFVGSMVKLAKIILITIMFAALLLSGIPSDKDSGKTRVFDFLDDFSGGLGNWNVASGTWGIANGLLESSEIGKGIIYTQGKVWKDCTLTAEVKITGDTSNAEAAFCLHLIDQWNFIWAGIGCWGHKFSISRTMGNVSEELISSGDAADIARDTWYIVSVQISGDAIALYINGFLELAVNDSTFARGMVGIESSNSHTLVDYVAVSGALSFGSVKPGTYAVALDGSGDFTDIQKAIDAVPSSSEGVIEIMDGVYDLNPSLTYPFKSIIVRSNLTMTGMGIDRTVIRSFPTKQSFGSNIRAISIASRDNIENLVMENMTVVQNGTPDNIGWGAIDLRAGTNENVTVRNVKVTDVTGAAIGIARFDNVIVENSIIERAWTGIVLAGGSNGLLRGNRIINTTGDGIFPRGGNGLSVTDLKIEDNYLENIGDTGIDITGISGLPPHERIVALHNTLNNASIRVSHAQHVEVSGNIIEGGHIDADSGAGQAVDITVKANNITTSHNVGIGFYGTQDCYAVNNEIHMTAPSAGTVQSGIVAAIRGTGLIERNIITGSANYGIDFGGWRLGSDSGLTIRGNVLLDFNDIGIYDEALSQGTVLIENNTIWDRRQPFVSKYGIRTDYEANEWTIRYNHIFAGSISLVSAPSSNVYDNIYAAP
jgi:hypothetical protein